MAENKIPEDLKHKRSKNDIKLIIIPLYKYLKHPLHIFNGSTE